MKILSLFILLMGSVSCQPQTNTKMSENKTNPLLCDPVAGICEMPDEATADANAKITGGKKPVKIIYYTDPICSSCWGIEPQLRKLKLEYGDYFEIDYRMGGLLPDWSYNSGGISKPSDVAHHWDEVSLYYEMPIDGDVWLENPLDSSYPSCIAVKAAQLQDKEKAVVYMRLLREKLFLEKKNMAKPENLLAIAKEAGLDAEKFQKDYSGAAKQLFEEDLAYGRTLGVRGFPTLFFSDADGNKLTVYGFKPYNNYEQTLRVLCPDAKKTPIDKRDVMSLFNHYPSLTAKEYAVILDRQVADAKTILEKLVTEGKLKKTSIKTGVMYTRK